MDTPRYKYLFKIVCNTNLKKYQNWIPEIENSHNTR